MTNKVDERQVLTVVESFFRSFTESVSQKVQTELSDSKKYLYDLEEELRFQLTSYESRFMGVKKECETFHTEKLLEEKSKEEDLRGL